MATILFVDLLASRKRKLLKRCVLSRLITNAKTKSLFRWKFVDSNENQIIAMSQPKKPVHTHNKKGIGAVARQTQESHSRSGSPRGTRDRDLGGPLGDERESHRHHGERYQPVGKRAASTAAANATAARPLGAFNRTIQSEHSGSAHGHSVPTGGRCSCPTLP